MKTYVRYPLNIKLVFAMFFLTMMSLFQIINASDGTHELIYLVFCIIYFSIITVAVIRRFLKPKLLQIKNEELTINSKLIAANDINKIFIDGSYIVGIKPKKNTIVPIRLCFKFTNMNSDINRFIDWAKDNNIEVENRTFMKWI